MISERHFYIALAITSTMSAGSQSRDQAVYNFIDTLPVLVSRAHNVYDYVIREKPEFFGPMFELLGRKERLPHRALERICGRTLIPLNTLKTWRRKLKQDPSWRPKHGSPGSPRLITVDQETALRQRIVDEYVSKHRLITRQQTQALAREMFLHGELTQVDEAEGNLGGGMAEVPHPVQHEPDEETATQSAHEPKFSRHWQERFEQRTGLSYRVPHLRRRTQPNDEMVAKFVEEIELAQGQFTRGLILNADETCWRIVNGQIKTFALKGSQEVILEAGFDMKQAVTVMACMSANGDKLPLVVIAEGTTELCEQKFRKDKRLRHYIGKSLFIDHTERGWSTHEFAKRYLKFLRNQMKDNDFFLLWDLHASHRKEDVKEYARNNSIYLSYVPAGQTSYWQPLDSKPFGALKKRAMKEFHELALGRELTSLTIVDAVWILVRAWDGLPESTMRRGWDTLLGPNTAPDILTFEEEENDA